MSCSRAPAADSDRVALEAAINRWTVAVNAQDVATLRATMTEDVELLNDATSVTGRDAAVQSLGEVVTRGPLTATSRKLTIADDVAWHVVSLTQSRKNGDVHALGQAFEIWKRVNGEWKLNLRTTQGGATPGDLLTRPSTSEPVLDQPKN